MKDNFFSNTEPKMKRLLIYSLAILTLAACGEKIKPGNTEPKEGAAVKATVGTARVTQQPVFYEAVGTLSARTASTVASKLMGVVRAVHVHEGDLVKKGDLLVTIDQRQVQARLEQASAHAQIAAKE